MTTSTKRRDWLFVGCEAGHDWISVGGCNAGCHVDCHCSVPVLKCSRCGDCDYGEGIEAKEIRQGCVERNGTMEQRIAAYEAERIAFYQQEPV